MALHDLEGTCLLAFPAVQVGRVHLFDLGSGTDASFILEAHGSEDVASIAFNLNGSLLATSSKSGTIVRVFDIRPTELGTRVAKPKAELSRSKFASAVIVHLAFDESSKLLAVLSSTGTVHVFDIAPTSGRDANELWKFKVTEGISGICRFSSYNATTGTIGKSTSASTPCIVVVAADATMSTFVLPQRDPASGNEPVQLFRFFKESTSIFGLLYGKGHE